MLVIVGAALVAGTVRGFSGFGTALIYMPLAGMVLGPVEAVTTLILMDLVGPIPMFPTAARNVHRGDLLRLLAGVTVAVPVGLSLLFVMDGDLFRGLVSAVSLVMLAGMALGWRYSGGLGPRAVLAIGASSGFLGGVSGIPGPPVIFAYMASRHPPEVIRANITFFLFGYDWIVVGMLALAGRLELPALLTGLLLIIPNMVGTFIGTALFVPGRERLYRGAAYVLIFFAAMAGLPIWGG